ELRGRARTVRRRAGDRLALLTNPLEPELDRRLRLLDGRALPRVVDPAADLLVALPSRLGAEVVADGEAGEESHSKSHAEGCTAAVRVRTHPRCSSNACSIGSSWHFPRSRTRGGREPAAVGYRGKVKERERARALRAQNHTLADIAET